MFHDNIKKLRKDMGLTQKPLASYLNVERSTYSYYESGKSLPNIQTLIELSEIFGVSCDCLLKGKISLANSQHIDDIRNTAAKKEREILCYFRILPITMQDKVLDLLKTYIKKSP